jgi:beta-lactamase class C
MKSGLLLAALMLTAAPAHAADDQANVKAVVDAALKPVMAKYHIPGMAVGVAANGKSYVFTYGEADAGKPVTPSTLFELGSISKTFLVTSVSLEREEGAL